jgi:hypothetical protein
MRTATRPPTAPRLCGDPDCATALSRYNPDDRCARHGGWIVDTPPAGHRPTPAVIDLRDPQPVPRAAG